MFSINNFIDHFSFVLQNIDMQQKTNPRLLERAILDEIAAIDKKQADLHKERHQLERMLLRIRRENIGTVEVTRKNSLGRILVENMVIERLRLAEGKTVSAAELLSAARLKDPKLKSSTFRSYLHRMKAGGTIVRANSIASKWLLPINE